VENNSSKKIGFLEILTQMLNNFVAIIGETLTLASLELQLAGKSLLILIILGLLSGLFLFAFWLLGCTALAMWLNSFFSNLALCFLMIAVLNLLLVGLLVILMLKAKRSIRLPSISKKLSYYGGKAHETINSKTEKFTREN
jgi:hypothetical protein